MCFASVSGTPRLARYKIWLQFPNDEGKWKVEKELDLNSGKPDKHVPSKLKISMLYDSIGSKVQFSTLHLWVGVWVLYHISVYSIFVLVLYIHQVDVN